jgi:hypothetical protein
MVGTEVIRVRTEEDLKEMWGEIRKNRCTTLWCDGLVDHESQCKSGSSKSNKSGRKRKRAASDEESEDEATSSQSTKTQKKKKIDEVQEVVDSLKTKHGTKYTVFQLRIWAELITSGLYTSTEEPPCNNNVPKSWGWFW